MFLKNLMNKAKNIVDETEQIDERFYAKVMDELSQEYRDKALVGKAIAQSDGTETKFDSIYMKLRAKALQDDYETRQAQHQIGQTSQKLLNKSIDDKYNKGYFEQLFTEEIESYGYTISPWAWSGYNNFKKDSKKYLGKIDYETMSYVIVNEQGKYMHMFKFKPN